MKKRLAVVLSLVCAVSMLTACGNKGNAGSDAAGSNATVAEAGKTDAADQTGQTEGTVAGGALKTGLALLTTVSGEDATADADGMGQGDALVVAVTVDENGVITNCVIDSAQTKMVFDASGAIKSDMGATYPSKQEIGANYGMKAVSPIGKEWNEQVDAFAAYCVGKTADEVGGIAVSESGVATDADLAASCTIHITSYQEAVKAAVANATVSGASAGDKLGIGLLTTIDKSKNATADAAGLLQAYTNVAAVTVDANGVVTSAKIDAVQAEIGFDATGKITSDLTARVDSKNAIGDAYGMKKASGIGKEWYEQADAYAQYAVGKTAAEVSATELTQEGIVADVDLAASVTVHVSPFNTAIEKAANNAK